ncbi:hypothetical protein WR25_09575 [Diploscapter pachys]|uniref:Histone acetyltransferase n=1 Tax=Diploscapter pachys TaxID=2018661 RepID=A0A2A2KX27_9BILA|nr:hypothetical protein WR25_09575 [Diploscapter pachys]
MQTKRLKLSEPLQLFENEDLETGIAYYVKRFNGVNDEKLVATLVEIRDVCDAGLQKNRDEKKEQNLVMPGTQMEKIVTTNGDVLSEEKRHKLYYIHYEGMDRRMDEWVERERFIEKAPAGAVLITPEVLAATGNSNADAKPQMTGALTRSQRRIHEEFHHMQKSYDDMDAYTAKLEKEHEQRTKVKNIDRVVFGRTDIQTWYFSPYPKECHNIERLYVCEYCLAYTPIREQFACHVRHTCTQTRPPGQEIYRNDDITIYEVSGVNDKIYCQSLCLLSKLFMDHKTLYYDVQTFMFYILCEIDRSGSHLVGHFSKEQLSENNLACIMILPPFQRKGYGKLLIQLSYELSNRERWIGTPEKPLSDMGKVSYRSYWWWILIDAMEQVKDDTISATELSHLTKIAVEDIVSTLQTMCMVKYWKGQYIVRTNKRLVEHCKSSNIGKPPKVLLDTRMVKWEPTVRRDQLNGGVAWEIPGAISSR